jgi:hypothetical protein
MTPLATLQTLRRPSTTLHQRTVLQRTVLPHAAAMPGPPWCPASAWHRSTRITPATGKMIPSGFTRASAPTPAKSPSSRHRCVLSEKRALPQKRALLNKRIQTILPPRTNLRSGRRSARLNVQPARPLRVIQDWMSCSAGECPAAGWMLAGRQRIMERLHARTRTGKNPSVSRQGRSVQASPAGTRSFSEPGATSKARRLMDRAAGPA